VTHSLRPRAAIWRRAAAARFWEGVRTGRATPGMRAEGAAFEAGERGDAGDLLDEVGLALDVGAPGGGRDVIALHGEAEGDEDAGLLLGRDVEADEAGDTVGAEGQGALEREGRAGHDDLGGLAAAELEDEAGGELEAGHGGEGIDAALEAVARVGVDLEPPAGAGGADGVEPGALDEDVGRLLGHAGPEAAHDAADRLGTLLVADEGLGAVEAVGPVVEGDEALAGLGEADADGAAELRRVEDVEGPGAVVGDEVRHVDEGRDRAEADRLQAGLEPGGRRAVPDAADQSAGEEGAGLLVDVGGEVDADGAGKVPEQARSRA
jgi:hypothetical protein